MQLHTAKPKVKVQSSVSSMPKTDCEDKDSKVFSVVLPKVFSGNSISGNSPHNRNTNPLVSRVLCSSDSEKHPGLHGLYAASSQGVQQ